MLLPILIFSLLNLNCSGEANNKDNRQFVASGEYRIDLDQFTSPVEEYFQFVPSWRGNDAIAFHIRKKGEIKLYDLKSGKLTESLKYADDGPNAFQNIYDFHIHDEDHIFLNRKYHYKTHLVNKDFELKKTYGFLEPGTKLDPSSGIPLASDTFLPIFDHNKIIKKNKNGFIVSGFADVNRSSPKAFAVNCLLVEVNEKTGEIKRLLGYPLKMKGKAWGTFHGNLYTFHSELTDMFYLSFAADEELYLAENGLNILNSFEAKPTGFKPIKPIPPSAANSDKAYLNHYNEQYIFGSVLYDEYRDLVYRIALEPNPDYGDVFVKDPLYRPRNMVVMAFDPDQDYKKVAEMRLVQSGKGVYLDRCFVNEKGLNITYVDLENEDKLYFKTFLVE
ncbi:uncharacterized protein DUF4221 [Cecembia calidifontis]|uniref:Uncharacterized protein DUF4221 n=1 Tax=Cecembia calidifontis TaxID=1187080 RepID=A0A4Q7P7I8_9BACT|nr:uncharacterized protein DUF4221 [Cecembia calidifontis]